MVEAIDAPASQPSDRPRRAAGRYGEIADFQSLDRDFAARGEDAGSLDEADIGLQRRGRADGRIDVVGRRAGLQHVAGVIDQRAG